MEPQTNPSDLLPLLLRDKSVRLRVTSDSHDYFFHTYFHHYVKYRTAPFQKEMLSLAEDDALRTVVITAFRGSAKSTIMNLSYPLWSILGKPQKKFVLIVGQTQQQSRQHLKNVKDELERNDVLKGDLGPFREEEDEWRNSSLVISNCGARIMAVSVDQSVRGLRHGPHRPDLIICDDIEDLASTKSREGRDKTYGWVKGELLPAGDRQTKIVFIGNLLHEDCLLRKLQREIDAQTLQGIYREYPLLTPEDACLWPGKYPTQEAIEEEKRRIGDEAAWHREFLLHILSNADRVIYPEWIKYYDALPSNDHPEYQFSATGIDLAISQSESADYTAMVSAKVVGYGERLRIYILPEPLNARLTSLETEDAAKLAVQTLRKHEGEHYLFIEEVGYQKALIERLSYEGFSAEGIKAMQQDKRARLAMVSHLVQNGTVVFPKQGAEKLLTQLLGFGCERYDDLADAFAILLMGALKYVTDEQTCYLIRIDPPRQYFGSRKWWYGL